MILKNELKLKLVEPFTLSDFHFTFFGCYVFSFPGKNFLLNRESGTSILIDDELLHSIEDRSLSDDLQFKLVQRGLAKSDNSPICANTTGRIFPTFFIIDLTANCNLRCSYCFRNLSITEVTSDEMIDKICDYISTYCIRNNLKRISIQPWGGEPLLALSKIFRIQENFQKNGIEPSIHIETNGTLITPAIAKELFIKRIQIGISIDGVPLVHDKQRHFQKGKKSSHKVYKSISILRDSGYGDGFGTITVVTKNSLPYVDEILDFFAKDLKLTSLKFNILRESQKAKENNLALSPIQIAAFTHNLLDKLINLYSEGIFVTEGNIMTKLNNILLRKNANMCISNGCTGGRGIISFDKQGNIFPCELTDYEDVKLGTIGHTEDLITLIGNAVKEQNFFSQKHIVDCDTCPWWYFCRGGCTSAIKFKRGDISGVDETECLVNKTLYPRLVDLILTNPDVAKSLAGRMADRTKREL